MKEMQELFLAIGNRGGKLLYTVPGELVLYEIAGAPFIHVLKDGKGRPFLFRGDRLILTRLHLPGTDPHSPGQVELFVFRDGAPVDGVRFRAASEAKSFLRTVKDRYGAVIRIEDRLVLRKTHAGKSNPE